MRHFSCANSMASMHSQLGFVDLVLMVGNGKRLREASGVDLGCRMRLTAPSHPRAAAPGRATTAAQPHCRALGFAIGAFR